MRVDVVAVGSLNMDLVAVCKSLPRAGETILADTFHMVCGGKGANQAVAAARLGARVAMVGRIGCDAFGSTLRDALSDEGIDVSEVREADGPSGVALIGVGAGENLIMVAPGANAALGPEEIMQARALWSGAAVVLCQLETPMAGISALVEGLAPRPTRLILDPAPAALPPASVLARVDWLTPNESEAASLLGGPIGDPAVAAARLLALGPRNVVLKLGRRGAFLSGTDVAPVLIETPSVTVVDSTAAGDTFNGAFGAALAGGAPPARAARFACRAAAVSVSRHGAQPSLPRLDEVGPW